MGAPSHQDMEKRSQTVRSMAIPSTGRGTGPAVFGVTAAPGTAITGTATVGTVAGTADVDAGAGMAAKVDMEAGADMAAEAGTAAAADTFPWSDFIRPPLTFRFEFSQSELTGASPCLRKRSCEGHNPSYAPSRGHSRDVRAHTNRAYSNNGVRPNTGHHATR